MEGNLVSAWHWSCKKQLWFWNIFDWEHALVRSRTKNVVRNYINSNAALYELSTVLPHSCGAPVGSMSCRSCGPRCVRLLVFMSFLLSKLLKWARLSLHLGSSAKRPLASKFRPAAVTKYRALYPTRPSASPLQKFVPLYYDLDSSTPWRSAI